MRVLDFPPPYEHQYSMGYIDIYICKTYINEGVGRWGSGREVRGKKKIDMLVLYPRPPYEHQYSLGNTDIYACEPQYILGNTYIKGMNERRGIKK